MQSSTAKTGGISRVLSLSSVLYEKYTFFSVFWVCVCDCCYKFACCILRHVCLSLCLFACSVCLSALLHICISLSVCICRSLSLFKLFVWLFFAFNFALLLLLNYCSFDFCCRRVKKLSKNCLKNWLKNTIRTGRVVYFSYVMSVASVWLCLSMQSFAVCVCMFFLLSLCSLKSATNVF